MTFDGRTATTLVMLVLFAGACLLALDLPTKAAFMPLLVGVPGTLMCTWQLIVDLRRSPEEPAAQEEASEGSSEIEVFVWLGLFLVVLLSLGFVLGGPLIVGAFIRFSSRERWRNAVFAAIGTFLVFWGIFIQLLELSLFEGLILGPLLG